MLAQEAHAFRQSTHYSTNDQQTIYNSFGRFCSNSHVVSECKQLFHHGFGPLCKESRKIQPRPLSSQSQLAEEMLPSKLMNSVCFKAMLTESELLGRFPEISRALELQLRVRDRRNDATDTEPKRIPFDYFRGESKPNTQNHVIDPKRPRGSSPSTARKRGSAPAPQLRMRPGGDGRCDARMAH